jgi:cytochrome c553
MKAKSSFALAGVCLALALTGTAQAADGDPVAGARKAATCLGCHGVPGYRNAYPSYRVPKLGGQHPEYIVAALKEYKEGLRDHDTMQALASNLSEQDMKDIAAYFALPAE